MLERYFHVVAGSSADISTAKNESQIALVLVRLPRERTQPPEFYLLTLEEIYELSRSQQEAAQREVFSRRTKTISDLPTNA